MNRFTAFLAILALLAFSSGCGPSDSDRQAEALLVKATELMLAGGKFQERHQSHAHAERLLNQIVAQYPQTAAAKRAKVALEKMPAIHEADRKIAAEELMDTYKKSVGDVMDATRRR